VDSTQSDLQALRELVRDLARRVDRLEQKLGVLQGVLPTSPPLGAALPRSEPPRPAAVLPPPPTPHIPPTPVAPASAPADEADLESRIGSHWLNRIGIAAVLIGVSYFLKYAFDNNWIGPGGRVTIGLLAGIAVVVWSERFRTRGYQMFSYSLKAVGIGVMYLSLWAAFQVYGLIPGGVALIAMLAVTASTAAMAIAQNAEVLAAFALTGGFATPLLLSTGQNRELELFSYIALLDVAAIVMVARKPWRRLLVLSYIGTLMLYIGWYFEFYNRSELNLTVAFATLFFAIFAVAPLVARQPEGEAAPFAAIPLFLAFVNAGVYFLEVYAMVEEIDKHAMAWFALALAAVYIFLSRQAREYYPDKKEDAQRLHYLHLALAVGFITIAIPIRLDGHWITIGWLVEAAVLLWLGDRIRSSFLSVFAVGALALGVVRLLAVDNFKATTLIFNARMGTYAVAIAVLAAMAWYGQRRNDEMGRQGAAVAVVALNVLALIALSHEVSDYYARQMAAATPGYNAGRYTPYDATSAYNTRTIRIAEDFTYSALWMAYGAMLMIVGFWRRSSLVRWQALVLIAATIVKVFVYDFSQLDRGYRIVSFIVLGVLLLAISFVYQRDWLQLSSAHKKPEESAPGV
jgi:uncharacterized membrane protein